MRRLAPLLLAALLGTSVLAPAQAQTAASATLSLRVTPTGVLVQGRVTAPGNDELTGLWSSAGRARLLRCAPRCAVVQGLPIASTLTLGPDSTYRIVLGGKLRAGQRLSLVLRLRSGKILNTSAAATR